MITYDLLQNLENNCLELLHSTNGMISGNNDRSIRRAHEKILGAVRKIIIANEMTGRGIICISGLQGAGKTSLIKNFYGLNEEYFNISLGRGEKIPVFICEKKELTHPAPYAVTLEKDEGGKYVRKHVKMSAEEFRLESSCEEIDSQIMYLELWVPYTHLKNESYAFMLLPGFEGKRDYWENLIDFSVKCSDTSIFVFDESSFSKYDNQVLLEKIKKIFGEGLIYAISKSDLSDDDNAGVKKTCIEVMKIDKGEEDRVVCVGEYDNSDSNNKWISELKDAIEKYCNSIETARKNCSQYIHDIIEDDIRPELSKIKDGLGSDTGDAIQIHLENASFLKAFDDIVKDRRKKFDKQIDMALSSSSAKSSDRLERLFSDKSYAKEQGLQDKRLVLRTVFGENIKDVKLARERVETALKREDGTYDFQYALFDAISQTTISVGENTVCRAMLTDDKAEMPVVDDEPNTISEESQKKQQEILQDIATLLAINKSGNQFVHNDPVETMKIMAELSVQYFGLSTMSESCRLNSQLQMPEVVIEKIQISQVTLKKEIGSTEKMFWGALGITGIDILDDGIINTIPKLIESFGSAFAPVVGTAVAALTIGTAGIAVMRDINRIQRTEVTSAKNAISSIHSQIKLNYLSAYDDAMEMVRGRIEDNLISLSGINKKMLKKTNAMIAMSKIEDDLETISKEATKNVYIVGNAFK